METEISNAKSTVNTTSTRSLTWDDRVKYCEEWRKTGLSKSEFSRRKGLSISLFCKWCNRLWPDETKTNNKQNKVTMWADD